MRIVVHAGMHKTGSSSVQAWLARNAAALKSHGIHAFLTDPVFVPKSIEALDRKTLTVRMAEARDRGVETLIISHESLSVAPPDLIAALREIMAPSPVELVVAIRHWHGYLPSRWKQNCLRRDSQPFHTFLHRLSEGPLRPDFRFDLALRSLRHLDPHAERIISYDVAVSTGNPVETVLRALGVPAPLIRAVPPPVLNRAVPTAIADRIRLVNAAVAERHGLGPDALFDSFSTGSPVGRFFDMYQRVEQMREDAPDVFARLDGETGKSMIATRLDTEAIEDCEKNLGRVIEPNVWNASVRDALTALSEPVFHHASIRFQDLAAETRRDLLSLVEEIPLERKGDA